MAQAGPIRHYRSWFRWEPGKGFDEGGVGGVIRRDRCHAHFGLWVQLGEFVLYNQHFLLGAFILDHGF